MRQSGIMAAGALFALENNIERLADDHQAAQVLAKAVEQCDNLSLEPSVVDTNIVIFRVHNEDITASEFCASLKEQGVWALPFSKRHVRFVTHLDVSIEQCRKAGEILQKVASKV